MGDPRELHPRIWWKSHWSNLKDVDKDRWALAVVKNAPLAHNKFLDYFHKRTVLRAVKHVGSLVGKCVLDVGCGAGRWTSIWSQHGSRVVGIDISDYSLLANQKQSVETDGTCYGTMLVENLAFRQSSFDMVSSITVLQHIPYGQQKRAIREIVASVKPGGWILIHENVRKYSNRGKLQTSLTFPHSPSEWVQMFRDENCEVRFVERSPLMPLFHIYWFMRNALKKAYKQKLAVNQSKENCLERSQLHAKRNGLFDRFNFAAYWFITWPSWVIEFICNVLTKTNIWTQQTIVGSHQTFLFQKKR